MLRDKIFSPIFLGAAIYNFLFWAGRSKKNHPISSHPEGAKTYENKFTFARNYIDG